MKNPYETLGIDKNSTSEQIKTAYKKLALKHHPDRGGDESLFKELTEAYGILSDPEKKSNYDKFGDVDQSGIDINDIINNMFGFGDINIDDLLNDINKQSGLFGPTPNSRNNQQIPVFIKVQRVNSPRQTPAQNPLESPFGNIFNLGNIFEDILCNDDIFQSPLPNLQQQQQQQPQQPQQQQEPVKPKYDNIDVDITINDIINSSKKKINYTIIDLCEICRNFMIKCLTCGGSSKANAQQCYSCNGQGFIITNKDCIKCNNGLCKKDVEINISIPKGVPDNHIFQLKHKGSYNMEIQTYNHLKLTMKYKLPKNIQIHGNSIFLYIDLKLEELLCGFSKKVKYGNSNCPEFEIKMDNYFDPSEVLVYEKMGIPSYKKEKEIGDLVVKFNVIYPKSDNTIMNKYQKVFKKIFN